MVFATSPQLLRSSLFASESHDKLLGQEKFSTGCDRVIYLQPKSALGKVRKGASSGGSAPSTPKAVRDSVTAYGTGFGQSSSPYLQPRFATLDNEPPIILPTQTWSHAEALLTELQRSLLESQWALTAVERLELERSGSGSCSENEDVGTLMRSGRPSARQRRFEGRKQKAVSDDERLTHAASRKSKARKGKLYSVDQALESVSTLGYMRARMKRELLTAEEEVILSKKMKIGQNLRAARKKLTHMLGCEPADELWATSVKLPFRKLQSKLLESEKARDQMFVSNLRLVISVARRYTGYGISLSDLIQVGAVGLLRGLEKFDYKRGFKLSTYVHWWIRQGITRAVAEHSRTVRLPAHMHERLSIINRAAATLRGERADVSVKSLSKTVNMSGAMVSGALKATKKMTSLDKAKRFGNSSVDNDSMHNYVADPCIENDPWITVDKSHMQEDVDTLLATMLGKRECDIVRSHYGFDRADGRGVSLERISHRIGISRERARQLEKIALNKLSASDQYMDWGFPVPFK